MKPRTSLLVAILGSTMTFIDGTVVNVALPVMQSALGATVVQMQWVVEAYTLALASLLLVGGALGDRLGRRRIFVIGVVLFAIGSIACGAAPGATSLIAARGVQGIGGALLVPQSLALISAAYPTEEARGRAIGTWSAASAITTAIGPVAGGWLVAHSSWRWIFFFNVPVALAVVVLAVRGVAESRDESAPAEVDVAGASLAAVGLGAIVFALLDAPRAPAARSYAIVGAGVASLVAFVVTEARTEHPMMPLSLFRSRTFTGTNLLTLMLYAALGGGLFFVPFELVQVQRYSPAEAGAALLPFVALMSIMSPFAGTFVRHVGTRTLLVVGPLVAAAGFAVLAVRGHDGAYLVTFFPGILVLGLGMGLTVAPLTTAVMGSVDGHRAGVASGVNNAVSRTAGLLAVAALGLVLVARFDRSLDQFLSAMPEQVRAAVDTERAKLAAADLGAVDPAMREGVRQALRDAYTEGFRAMMLVCAGLAGLGALCAGVLVKGPARNGSQRRRGVP